jgi:hypothetical protein
VTSVKISELAIQKLSAEVVIAIDNVDEVDSQNIENPSLCLIITENRLHIDIHKSLPIKKTLATVGSIIGTVWALIEFILPHLSKLFS